MKILPILAALTLSTSAAEQVVTLGDSLTFAYEAEFGFEVNVIFQTYGDGFGPEVKNWIEILSTSPHRPETFDIGARIEMSNGFLFRHQYNWALPGLKIEELRQFVAGEKNFTQMVYESDPLLLLFATFFGLDTTNDFKLSDLEFQISSQAERLVFFIGGNDVRAVYGTIYNGGSPGTFVPDFISDATAILDRVLALNPNIQIVVVNVPHIGITPDIKASSPTDPVKTDRVTAVLRDLNQQLRTLAEARGLGYADVFTPTLSLLDASPLCIHGIPFVNTGSTTGNLDYVWLNGQYSANFHPNTNAHTLIANEIIDAFNSRYQTGIAPLTATEILSGLHGKSPAAVDMPFTTWMTNFGLTGLPASNDSDGDGIPSGAEFALGLNPTLSDSRKVVTTSTTSTLELAYPIRLPASSRYTLSPVWSPDLTSPFVPFSTTPVTGPDGLARAVLPFSENTGFMRLQSTLVPLILPETPMQNPISNEKLTDLEQRLAALGVTENDLLEKFVRGSGAGGQKINKTSNCVFLKHLPTGVCIKCQMDRSREMNRFLARRELCEQLEAIRDGKTIARTQAIEKMRRQKRPRSRRSKQRSVADKRILSRKKSMRRPPSGD